MQNRSVSFSLTRSAARIREYILHYLSAPQLGTVALEALDAYDRAWRDALKKAEPPFAGVATALYQHLNLDDSVPIREAPSKRFELLFAISILIAEFGAGWWKALSTEYQLFA